MEVLCSSINLTVVILPSILPYFFFEIEIAKNEQVQAEVCEV